MDRHYAALLVPDRPGQSGALGRFKLGRDRTGEFAERQADQVKIETSLDGQAWQTVFQQSGLTKLPGFDPAKTTVIAVKPVRGRFVKVTVRRRALGPERRAGLH